ncbi:hypothetical protein LCGC14_3126310 [marine sediment metagenome]|uniref:Uncharacterized protein n=1 Tax=marine sediment metagenome TaxID=412755 RepID=A0A0F8W108_9ZZZZ
MNEPKLPAQYDVQRATLHALTSSEHLWGIASFLRGPDFELPDSGAVLLKRHTTARVRAISGAAWCNGVIQSTALTVNELKERERLLGLCPVHFRRHWRAAIRAIQKLYGYDLSIEQPLPPRGTHK